MYTDTIIIVCIAANVIAGLALFYTLGIRPGILCKKYVKSLEENKAKQTEFIALSEYLKNQEIRKKE